jgi:hypothetical protein
MIAGLVLLGLSAANDAAAIGTMRVGPLFVVTGGFLALLGLAAALAGNGSAIPPAVVLGFGAGVLTGLGALYTKGLFLSLEAGFPMLAWLVCLPILLVANLGSLWILQAGFQQGRALVVVALNAVTNKVVAIFGGIVTLGEILPPEPLFAIARVAGFMAILGGTAVLARFEARRIAEELTGA